MCCVGWLEVVCEGCMCCVGWSEVVCEGVYVCVMSGCVCV